MRDVLRPVYRADESNKTFKAWATVAAVLNDNSWARLRLLNKDLNLIQPGNVEGCKSTMKNEKVLQKILSFEEVVKLDLRGCLPDRSSFSDLHHLPSEDPRIKMLISLRKLENVQTLILKDCSIISKECEQIFTDSRHTKLTSLDLSHNYVAVDANSLSDMSGIKALAKYLENNSVLTKLVLSYNRIGDEGAIELGKALEKNKSLKELELANCWIGPNGGKAFAAALSESTVVLEKLDLSSNNLTNYGKDMSGILEIAEALKSAVLTHLNLFDNKIGREGAKALADALKSGMAKLTSIDVGFNSEEAALGIVRAARQHDRITFLGLASCKIGPTGAKEIAEYVSDTAVLTSLDLSDNELGIDRYGYDTYDPTGIQALASALVTAVLTSITLDGETLPVEKLRGTEPVETLNLSQKRLGMLSAIVIAKLIESNAVLNKIVLSYNRIRDEGAIALGEALKMNKSLKELELIECWFGPNGGKALAAALSEGTAVLNKLDLSVNYIEDAGAIALGEALKMNTSLKELKLINCRIRPDGGKALAAAFSEGTTAVLNKLDLTYNDIKDEGASALGEALKINTSLTELVLDVCEIGPDGGKALASALSKGTTVLKSLNLSRNCLCGLNMHGDGTYDPTGIQELASALGTAVLTECSLLDNKLDIKSATMVANIGRDKRIMLSGMKRDQTEVNFRYHGLQPADAILIASDLQFMAEPTKLVLSHNYGLGNEGAITLGEALKSNTTLTELELDSCNIGAEGGKALASGLGTSVLTHLNLSYNDIGSDGAKALADALQSGTSVLTSLNLSNNKLCGVDLFGIGTYDPSGIRSLASALAGSAVLTNLDVSGNSLTNEDTKVLQDAAMGRTDFELSV